MIICYPENNLILEAKKFRYLKVEQKINHSSCSSYSSRFNS